jgi:hypothetical protein
VALSSDLFVSQAWTNIVTGHILSRVYVSVTNNNGFWIR